MSEMNSSSILGWSGAEPNKAECGNEPSDCEFPPTTKVTVRSGTRTFDPFGGDRQLIHLTTILC